MVLRLSSSQFQTISAHAQQTYPEECCGLLIGHLHQEGGSTKTVVEVWEVENAWTADVEAEIQLIYAQSRASQLDRSKLERYWIDPQDMLNAQRSARDRHLNVIGIYHSHPNHPAIPSECDRLLAWAEYSYIIVSVQEGISQDVRCWHLDSNHQFQSEEIIICQQV